MALERTLSIIKPDAVAKNVIGEIYTRFEKAGLKVAEGLIDALEKAYTHIGRQPGTGSPRYAHELQLPGLRSWPLTRYPYLVFYVEHNDHVDVWRVLHAQRDIPAWLQGQDGPDA